MERRGFLKSLAGGAVGWAVAGVVGEAMPPIFRDQVTFISHAEAAGLGVSFAVDPTLTAQLQASTYPQSVAAGDPNPQGVVLWTRVDPTAAGSGTPNIGWQVSADPAFGSILIQGVAQVSATRDNTVKLPIVHPALKPSTTYYYRFVLKGVASKTGRFKTMPLATDALAKLRIGVVNCQDWSNGYYTAYRYLAQEDVDVVIHLGDYIYEYLGDGTGGAGNGPVRTVPGYPSGAQYPATLADYRHLYQTYRSDPDIQAMHEKFAFIQLWDDHEFMNDCHQVYHEDTNPPGITATTPQPALRQTANQAWGEHSLAAVPFNANLGPLDSIKLYRTFKFGNLADIIVTDQRLYRDGPPCGDVNIGQRYQTTGCANQFSADRTMLGATQKAWFLDQVTKSTATWKIWANEVMLAQYVFGPPAAPQILFFDLDAWDGYPVERATLLGTIKAAGVKNFVALTGDAHLYMAASLKVNYNSATEVPMGTEFLFGAVSSGNYLDALVDSPAPASSLVSIPAGAQRAAQLGLPMDGLERLVLAYNPHMKFWNGSTWGYGIVEVTPQSMIVDFRVVTTVKTPNGSLQQLASFTVPVNSTTISQTVV